MKARIGFYVLGLIGLALIGSLLLRIEPALSASNYTVPVGIESLVQTFPPKPAPTAAFVDGAGAPLALSKFRGRVLVVNFWATWCPPCLKEMPSLNRMQESVAPRGIEVLAISADRGGIATAKPFLERHGYSQLRPYADPEGALARAFGLRGLPTTIIINSKGFEVGRLEGPADWDSPQILKAIERLLVPPKAKGT